MREQPEVLVEDPEIEIDGRKARVTKVEQARSGPGIPTSETSEGRKARVTKVEQARKDARVGAQEERQQYAWQAPAHVGGESRRVTCGPLPLPGKGPSATR